MKKSYVKPRVYFENFQLSANIAGNCGGPNKDPVFMGNHSNAHSCTWSDGEATLFIENAACTSKPDGNICYDVPFENNRIFGS